MSRATCDETASLVSAACVSESTTAADTDGTPCDGPCRLQHKRDRVLCVVAQAAIGIAGVVFEFFLTTKLHEIRHEAMFGSQCLDNSQRKVPAPLAFFGCHGMRGNHLHHGAVTIT